MFLLVFFSEFICPSLGFYQFLSDDFLNQILSWQKDVGCFGTMKRPKTQKLLQTQLFEGYEYEDDFQDLKFDSLLKNNNSGSNKNSYTIQPPSLSLVTETNKRLGNVHMTSNVVMQKGTDLVHRTSNKVLNTFSQGSGFKVTSPPKVKAGLRRLLVEKLLNGMLYFFFFLTFKRLHMVYKQPKLTCMSPCLQ